MRKYTLLLSFLALFLNISFVMAGNTIASTIVMVPPENFNFNAETAKSNAYQHSADKDTNKKAMHEFNGMVTTLRKNGVHVIVLPQHQRLPDAVFPNNWFSTHADNKKNTVILYPMLTPNRQAEVNRDGLIKALKDAHLRIDRVIDLRNKKGDILEGTGSMIMDRKNHLIYASLSARTNQLMVKKIAELLDYKPVVFNSVDANNQAIYHTNVMMGLADKYAVICLDCISNGAERNEVITNLKKTGKAIIAINQAQVSHLCGNVIELSNKKHQSLLIMSKQAYEHFTLSQKKEIKQFSRILPMDLKTIESVGGGSARCMIAEVFFSGNA